MLVGKGTTHIGVSNGNGYGAIVFVCPDTTITLSQLEASIAQ